jgi:hypothetical protein
MAYIHDHSVDQCFIHSAHPQLVVFYRRVLRDDDMATTSDATGCWPNGVLLVLKTCTCNYKKLTYNSQTQKTT